MKKYLEFVNESLDTFDKDVNMIISYILKVSDNIKSGLKQFQQINNRDDQQIKKLDQENIAKIKRQKEEKDIKKEEEDKEEKFKEKIDKIENLIDNLGLIFNKFYKKYLSSDIFDLKQKVNKIKKPDQLNIIYGDVLNLQNKYNDMISKLKSSKKLTPEFQQKLEDFKKSNNLKSVRQIFYQIYKNLPKEQEPETQKQISVYKVGDGKYITLDNKIVLPETIEKNPEKYKVIKDKEKVK